MQIDQLVIALMLDATGFTKGQKDATAAAQKGAADLKAAAEVGEKAQTDAAEAIVAGLNRLAAAMEKGGDQHERQAKRTVEGNKKVAGSFEGAIRTGLTFLAVLAGARTVQEFTRKITELDAALGRTSYSMGQSPQALSALGKAVERMGGDFNGAIAGMRALSDAYQDFRTTGSSALIEPMTRLQALSGKTVSFGKDTRANFESIADALQALDAKGEHALADRLGRQILGNDDLVNLAKRGGAAVRAELAESERHGVIDPKDVKAAQDLQKAYVGLSQSVVGLGTKIETALSPYLSKLLKYLDDLIDKHGAEWVEEFSAFLDKHKPDIEAFGKAVLDLVTASGSVATAFSKQSPMTMALEAFAGLLTVRLLNPLNLVLAAMRAIGSIPLTGVLAAVFGAKVLSDNTVSNLDPWRGEDPNEAALRFLDPGAADRIYGKRGEQRLHGPHHGVGVHAPPKDDRNLWQRTMPSWLGGQDAPQGAAPQSTPEHRLRRAAKGPGARLRDRVRRGGGDAGPQSDAGAPGANGFGLIDAPYRASVDRKGEGGHLSPRELFDYLKSRGATDNEATMLTGAAGNESSFNPHAVHDNGNGYGLWGHNIHDRIDMRGMTWQQQADAALAEAKRDYARRINAARTPQELADAEMRYERPRGYHSNNPRGGDNYTGRLHTIDRFSKSFGTLGNQAGATAQAPIPAGTPEKTVTDAEVFAARQRLAAGGRDPKDIELRDRYLRQQNTPAPASHPDDDRASRARGYDGPYNVRGHLSPVQYTHGGGENALTRLYKDGALKVDLTDSSTHRLGQVTVGQAVRHTLALVKQARGMAHHRSHPPAVPTAAHMAMHGNPHAMDYHRSVMGGARDAIYNHHAVTNHIDRSTSSETKIGSITVHTQSKDAAGLAGDLDGIYQRAAAAGRRNYGLA